MTTTKLDQFTEAYIVCALWSSTDDKSDPLDKNYSIDDIAPETLDRMIADCVKFQEQNAALIKAAELSDSRAGHCFWLNRNGHGSGFWDEYFEDSERARACDKLSEACKAFGECDLYIGDDGRVYA